MWGSPANTAKSCLSICWKIRGAQAHVCSQWKCIQQKVLRPFPQHNWKIILLHFACQPRAWSLDLDLFYPLWSTLITEGQCVEMPIFHVESCSYKGWCHSPKEASDWTVLLAVPPGTRRLCVALTFRVFTPSILGHNAGLTYRSTWPWQW